MPRTKGAKNKPKTKTSMFDPKRWGAAGSGAADSSVPAAPSSAQSRPPIPKDVALSIYTRLPEYEKKAAEFLANEESLEGYIRTNALVLMQMERDQAVLMPGSRTELAAAIRSRQNFIQRATELMMMIRDNREMRIREMELQMSLEKAEFENEERQ